MVVFSPMLQTANYNLSAATLNSKKTIKFLHLQKLANQSMLNDAEVSIVLFHDSKKISGCSIKE